MAEVFEIGRRAFDELLGSGVLRDQCRGYGDYVVVSCMARFARSPRRFWVVENFEGSYWACHRADGCQEVSLFNVATGGADYCHYYEVWHIVDDEDQQPEHDSESVNEYGKKPWRHVFFKFDEKEPDTATPPELPKEDLEELERIFPPMYEVKRLCVLSVGYTISDDVDLLNTFCYGFEAVGVEMLSRKITHPQGVRRGGCPFCEVSWTVARDSDMHSVVSFMQKMMRAGCMVELGWRDVEVAR